MAILKIIKYPDAALKKKAAPVLSFTAQTRELIKNMLDTMRVSTGIGLAATQIGIPLQIIVISGKVLEEKHIDIVLLNPKIIQKSGKKIEEEGCLSMPGIFFKIKRYKYVKVQAITEHGKEVTLEGEGYISRVLQHEIDHLNGITMVERLPLISRLKAVKEIKKKIKEGVW